MCNEIEGTGFSWQLESELFLGQNPLFLQVTPYGRQVGPQKQLKARQVTKRGKPGAGGNHGDLGMLTCSLWRGESLLIFNQFWEKLGQFFPFSQGNPGISVFMWNLSFFKLLLKNFKNKWFLKKSVCYRTPVCSFEQRENLTCMSPGNCIWSWEGHRKRREKTWHSEFCKEVSVLELPPPLSANPLGWVTQYPLQTPFTLTCLYYREWELIVQSPRFPER